MKKKIDYMLLLKCLFLVECLNNITHNTGYIAYTESEQKK